MLYSDTALEQLRTSLTNMGYPFETNQLDEKTVRLNVKVTDYTIPVWFLVDKQIFGFDMINGGSKTCSTIEEFTKYFSTYIFIYVNFIPKAKIVADAFEKDININTVYDNFSGNKEEGYTAKFRVLSTPGQFVLICKDNSLYSARLVTYTEDGSRVRVLTEYKYDLDDVNNITHVPTIYSYLTKLTELYGENDSVNIDRVGIETFEFTIEDLHITADVLFAYTKISYLIKDINGVVFDEVVEINNPYELQDLYLKCHDSYEAKSLDEDDSEPEQTTEESQESELSEQTDADSMGDSETESFIGSTESVNEDSEAIALEEDSEPKQDELNDSEEDDLEASTKENSEVESNTNPEEDKILESNNFSVKKVIGEENDLGLQFIVDNKIYFIDAEAAAGHGVPLDRFSEVVGTTEKHGVVMTADEIASRTFSKNVSSDVKKCEELIFRIFE
jgi:hypothetical protein